MKKIAFILPGFFNSSTESAYQKIGQGFENQGFKPIYVEITWKNKRVSDFLKQFENIYQNEKGNINVLLGFSFGALVAYLSTPISKPNQLYLCSMAPYFKEDLDFIPNEDKIAIGKKRLEDISKCSFNNIVNTINCPTTIFYGENEQMFVKRRVQLAKKLIKNSRIIVVKNADHNISDINYIESVKKEICSGFIS